MYIAVNTSTGDYILHPVYLVAYNSDQLGERTANWHQKPQAKPNEQGHQSLGPVMDMSPC